VKLEKVQVDKKLQKGPCLFAKKFQPVRLIKRLLRRKILVEIGKNSNCNEIRIFKETLSGNSVSGGK